MIELIFWISSALVAYTYVLYPTLLSLVNVFLRNTVSINNYNTPHISVIIALYNEESILERKLDNLKSIDYPSDKFEVLLGSDGSVDNTNDILRNKLSQSIKARIFSERRGKAAVLNELFSEAHGEIIVFSDANTFFEKDTITCLIRHFSNPMVGAVCGRLILQTENKSAGALGEVSYWNYENLIKKLESNIQTTLGATGAVYAIRKSLFQPLPTSKAVMDDFIISLRIIRQGYKVIYEEKAIAYERPSESVSGEFTRKVRIGAANFHGISEYFDMLHPRFGFVAFALWSHKIIRWLVPFFLIFIFATSGILAGINSFFQIVFVFQLLFLGICLLGYIAEKTKLHIGILEFPYYFLAMNVALLIGFIKFLRGSQPPAWEVIRS